MFKEPQHAAKQVLVQAQSKMSFHARLAAIREYLRYFVETPVLYAWLWVLLSFKIADGLAGPFIKTFNGRFRLKLFSNLAFTCYHVGAMAALLGAGIAGLMLKWWFRAACPSSFFLCLKF